MINRGRYLLPSFPTYTRARIMRTPARALCLSQSAGTGREVEDEHSTRFARNVQKENIWGASTPKLAALVMMDGGQS